MPEAITVTAVWYWNKAKNGKAFVQRRGVAWLGGGGVRVQGEIVHSWRTDGGGLLHVRMRMWSFAV